jgi:hypothetical protein
MGRINQEAIMPIDKYTKFILTVIACALLALVAQNVMGRSNAQEVQPPIVMPNVETPKFEKIQFCDSRGCVELFNLTLEGLPEACARALDNMPRPARP